MLEMYITTDNKTFRIDLPCNEQELEDALRDCGLPSQEDICLELPNVAWDELTVEGNYAMDFLQTLDKEVAENNLTPFELNRIAESLEAVEAAYDLEKLYAYLEATGYDIDYCLEHLDDAIFYPNMDLEEVAEECVDSGCFGNVTDGLKRYIDYTALARDLFFDGYCETYYGTICIC